MNTKLTLVVMALVAAAQIAVPSGIALRQEAALHWGRQIKVAIEPVDPSQPFMGRYVALGFRDLVPRDKGGALPSNGKVYVALEEDANGFAHALAMVAAPPENRPYLPARAESDYTGGVRAVYPFNRFYMPEEAAPNVERQVAARRRNRNAASQDMSAGNAYVTVRVWKDTAVLEQLYIDNTPVDAYLRGQAAADAGKTPRP